MGFFFYLKYLFFSFNLFRIKNDDQVYSAIKCNLSLLNGVNKKKSKIHQKKMIQKKKMRVDRYRDWWSNLEHSTVRVFFFVFFFFRFFKINSTVFWYKFLIEKVFLFLLLLLYRKKKTFLHQWIFFCFFFIFIFFFYLFKLQFNFW